MKSCKNCIHCHAYARDCAVCSLFDRYFSFDRAEFCPHFELEQFSICVDLLKVEEK